MAATTTTENPRLAFTTVAELAGVETAGLGTGDLAYVSTLPGAPGTSNFYFLDKASNLPNDNITVVLTKDAALTPPLSTLAPGRWIRSNILAA